jgi:GDPmannose 4,6-dehydratase
MKKAFITGITGQDGYFLSKFLLGKGYAVHGLLRRTSQYSIGSLNSLEENFINKIILHYGDVTDHTVVDRVIRKEEFDEIYHLAAQSFVGLSFDNPKTTYDINIGGTLNVINAVKEYSPKSRFYFAATSELFGKVQSSPQNENTFFYPRSPYGISKLAGYWTTKNYRESYSLFMTNGILFNHESEQRGKEFVTRKISAAAARIKLGKQDILEIGNLNVKRDWGYAKDYVEGMWLMLQYRQPDDFVLATGENHSIREFVEAAFGAINIEIVWSGAGVNEIGKDKQTGKILVKVNPEFFRPAEVKEILGDYSKARRELGWEPRTKFKEIVKIMIENDLRLENNKS